MQAQLHQAFSKPGRTDDFRQLQRRLVIVATDLDSGAAARFGAPGLDHVPISQAVMASAALPGLYPPVEIDGRSYVDGALKKTLHARVLLDAGVDLLLCLNPLVPFHAAGEDIPRLADGGLPLVLSQTFRSLIHSRLELGIGGYASSHPGVDIVLFEPDPRDPVMFLANTFSVSQRRMVAEHAYQQTRATLRSRRTSLGAKLARHGATLNDAVLDDEHRHLVDPRRAASRAVRAVRRLHEVLDDLEHALALTPSPARGRRLG
jgi:predicted acylesterase/phospholipase RssA